MAIHPPKMVAPLRPDLSKPLLLLLLAGLVVYFVLALLVSGDTRPGTPLNQSFAIIGSLCLLMPAVFFLMKRSGYAQSPPFWFVAHVLSGVLGTGLIILHAAGGSWLTPAGFVLLALLFLVVQGLLARALLSSRLSHLFARSVASFNFSQPLHIDRGALQTVIAEKAALLATLDNTAEEALFLPTLKHWLRAPLQSLRYQGLIEKESRLVGARKRAGWLLAGWRRLHLLAAVLFFAGLFAHVIVVLFFAGYVAGADEIYWWHLAAWGR